MTFIVFRAWGWGGVGWGGGGWGIDDVPCCLHPQRMLRCSDCHPHLMLRWSDCHPHLMLRCSGCHPHLMLRCSDCHPHRMLRCWDCHLHLMLRCWGGRGCGVALGGGGENIIRCCPLCYVLLPPPAKPVTGSLADVKKCFLERLRKPVTVFADGAKAWKTESRRLRLTFRNVVHYKMEFCRKTNMKKK